MTLSYTIESSIDEIDSCIKNASEFIEGFFKSKDDMTLYSLAIYEVLINALEHGNLGINYETKKLLLKRSKYKDKLFTLLDSGVYRDKKINISISIDEYSLVTQVEDEGNGFDFEYELKRQKEDGVIRESGRGLLLIKSYFDDIKFNKRANKITLIKNRI